LFVIPANAGIHLWALMLGERGRWIPAFAGMTIERAVLSV
jgi:hypothetical protein